MASTDLVAQGKALIQKNKLEEARQLFRQAVSETGTSNEALVWLAWFAFMEGHKEEGMRLLNQALEKQPFDAFGLALKGTSQLMEGDFQGAVDLLERAKKSDPTLPMIYSNLARAHRKLGNLAEAEKAARKAIEINSIDYLARMELSNILLRTSRTKQAIDELFECIRINPLFGKPYLILGQLYKQAGKPELVLDVYAKGLQYNPKAFPIREQLCDLLAERSDFRSAYGQAVELVTRRNSYRDYLRLGTYALAIGAFDEAQLALRKAVTLAPPRFRALQNDEFYRTANLPEAPEAIYPRLIDEIATARSARPL
jgi:tetratricopeptide (TPR) repeat protein